MLAVLRVVLETSLEPVQGRDPEKVHLGVAGLADRIQHETERLQNTHLHDLEYIFEHQSVKTR